MFWWSRYLEDGQYWLLYVFAMWIIVSICLHELAHGWAALQQGDSTPRDLGRMTINPMVHMGGMALIAFVIAGFTWGSMPVDRSRFKWGRWGEVWVAAAGPLMNLLLAVLLFTALGIACNITGVSPSTIWAELHPELRHPSDGVGGSVHKLHQALLLGGEINAALFVFNLIPLLPLDGASIVAGMSRVTYRLYNSPKAPLVSLIVLVLFLASPVAPLVRPLAGLVGTLYSILIFLLLGGAAA
jgi:Zn-dependent protease